MGRRKQSKFVHFFLPGDSNSFKRVIKDEVSPRHIQDIFKLDGPVYRVKREGTGVVTNIEDVLSGRYYEIVTDTIIPDQQKHIANSLMVSKAVYNDEPQVYLSSNAGKHSIEFVCDVSRFSDRTEPKSQTVLLAVCNEVGETKTLYIAYRGTKSYEDFITDLEFDLVPLDDWNGSKCHKGFLERSSTLSPQSILRCAGLFKAKRVVFCGHSLGGACLQSILNMKIID